jgi:hypothetical protein
MVSLRQRYSLDYQRGLWRTWVVIAVIWTVCAAYVLRPDFAVFILIDPQPWLSHQPADEIEMSTNNNYFEDVRGRARYMALSQLGQFSLVAALPPLALAALVLGCIWAARGFRKDP